MKIKKGDIVKIMVGKDKGKSGKISEVNVKENKVLIPGLNSFKKNKKPNKQGQKGEIITISRFIPVSNVQLLCGGCDRPTRVGLRLEGLKKIRFCKKCKVAI